VPRIALAAALFAGLVVVAVVGRWGDRDAEPGAGASARCRAEAVAQGDFSGCSRATIYRSRASTICEVPGAGKPVPRNLLLPRFDLMVNELRALEPPPSLAPRVAAWLATLDAARGHLQRARRATRRRQPEIARSELAQFTNLNIRAQFRADALGIEGCAETE